MVTLLLNFFLTAFIPLSFTFIILSKLTKCNTDLALSLKTTPILKAISCIIVVMIHFTESHQNMLQNAIGSFAYIAVTIFFLISSYGMSYSIDHKENYLKTFFRNRLSSIIIPVIITNILSFIAFSIINNTAYYNKLYSFNSFAFILTQFYILFYIVHKIPKLSRKTKDLILISIITISSFVIYLFNNEESILQNQFYIGWPWERMGLVWGIILYRYKTFIYTMFNKCSLKQSIYILIIGFIVGLCYIQFKEIFIIGGYLTKLFLGIIIITFALQFFSNRTSNSSIINFIAKISYEIFLVHELAMYIIDFIFPNSISGLFILYTYLLTFLLAYIAHYFSSTILNKIKTK